MGNLKFCNRCSLNLPLSSFSKNKSKKDGLQTFCKPCSNKSKLDSSRKINGLVSSIYSSQISSSKYRGHCRPSYTIEEFRDWILNNALFHTLFKEWVKSGYQKDLIPSVDRKNDYIGYTLSNIQLMTWKENRIKGDTFRKTGINNKQNITVLQFDLSLNLLESYHSAKEAQRQTSIDSSGIIKCCNNQNKTAGGFIWKYKKDLV